MNCTRCEKTLPVDHLEFCPFCGVRIKTPSAKYPIDKSPNIVNEEEKQLDICHHCGEEIILSAIKCIHCNERLDKKYDESKKKVIEVDKIFDSQIIFIQSPIVLSVLVLLTIIVGVVSLLSGVTYGTAIGLGVLSSLVFLLVSLKLIPDKLIDEMNENESLSYIIRFVKIGSLTVLIIILLSFGLIIVNNFKSFNDEEKIIKIRQCQTRVRMKYFKKFDYPRFKKEFDNCIETYKNE